MTTSAEQQLRAEAPTGLPDHEAEEKPLGPEDAEPDGEGDAQRGADAMPGIPTGGEPPTSG